MVKIFFWIDKSEADTAFVKFSCCLIIVMVMIMIIVMMMMIIMVMMTTMMIVMKTSPVDLHACIPPSNDEHMQFGNCFTFTCTRSHYPYFLRSQLKIHILYLFCKI